MKTLLLMVTLALLFICQAHAAAAIPTVADAAADLQAIGTVAAVCASLGLSIWLYRAMKRLMNETLDGDSDDFDADDESTWNDEDRAFADECFEEHQRDCAAQDFGDAASWDDPESEDYAPVHERDSAMIELGFEPNDDMPEHFDDPADHPGHEENDERADSAEEEAEDEVTEESPETASEDDEERRAAFISAYCTGMSDEERDNGGEEAAEEAADRLL